MAFLNYFKKIKIRKKFLVVYEATLLINNNNLINKKSSLEYNQTNLIINKCIHHNNFPNSNNFHNSNNLPNSNNSLNNSFLSNSRNTINF